MSSGHGVSIDLLTDLTSTECHATSGSGTATASEVTPGANAGRLGHEAGKDLSIDLFKNLSQQQTTSSVTAVSLGNPVDLLGDEVVGSLASAGSAPEHAPQTAAAPYCTADGSGALEQKPNGVAGTRPCETPSSAAGKGAQQPQQQTGKASQGVVPPPEPDEQPASPASQPPADDTFQIAQPGNPQTNVEGGCFKKDGKAMDRISGDGGGSQSLPSDTDPGRQSVDDVPSGECSEVPSGQGSDGDERLVDSDREVVEEEDAFGDFADFTSASHFLPGGVGGGGHGFGAAATFGALQPLSSASARNAGAGPASTSSPSAHRHVHLGSLGRPMHSMLGGTGGAGAHHGAASAAGGASISGAVSEHGSLGGEFSDFSHQSPPPSAAPSRGGGGRKSVASIASVGSRAAGDDDVGDYNSVVGSSVWRAPSQMATSSYAAAAGVDDDFGDFTSDITSTSDFAPSTQPPSAVAVSGPGSVHPDDDFGSFASHRSTADDDEDDFGNFNAAPAAAAAGAGPSGSGAAAMASTAAAATTTGGPALGSAGSPVPPAVAAFSPRDTAARTSGAHPYHSTQSVGPLPGGAASPEAAAAAAPAAAAAVAAATTEAGLLQLPLWELRQAVARALQPLLPAGAQAVAVGGSMLPDEHLVSQAWAQLRRHKQGSLAEWGGGAGSSVIAHTGVPLPPVGLAGAALAEASGGAQDGGGGGGRSGFVTAVKFTRPLRWKGSDSERRFLCGLGLGEVAAQARALEAAAEGARLAGRGRLDSATGPCVVSRLATFGDGPRSARADMGSFTAAAGLHKDTECESAPAAGGGGGGRSRGPEQLDGTHGSLLERGAEAASGTTPRVASVVNGVAAVPKHQHPAGGTVEK